MTKLSTQPYRGSRDFYPEDFALQQYIFDTWRRVCQSFGYEEYMTPTIEPIDLFTSKTSEEIVKEQTYSFTDRGGRNVTIRPEMTPSVARLVASKRQEFGYPLRLFSIPNCMRYERPQKGRLREFWQLNADIFGAEGVEADVEVIQLADALMNAFGAKPDQYEIRINSRSLLKSIIAEHKPLKDAESIVRYIDRAKKMSPDEFHDGLKEYAENYKELHCAITEGEHPQLNDFMKRLELLGVKATQDLTLARGFDYYTDIVFEVFDTNPDNNRSMFGGGRYDSLIGLFSNEDVASVGFGMGDATLVEFLKGHNLLKPEYTAAATDVLIATVDPAAVTHANQLAAELRSSGINVAVDFLDRKPDKKFKTAEKLRITHIIFIGPEEIETNVYQLKNQLTGSAESLTAQEIIAHFTD